MTSTGSRKYVRRGKRRRPPGPRPFINSLVAEEPVAQPGAVIAPGFGDLAGGLPRPSPPAGSPAP